ncbi:ribosomal protein S6 kinase-related protein [Patella vulgata]|uniref:ribosomal protein S6 kinase-related protein n=1 Tax=Patella vulgata TaxID=6465 RepID=UPI002180036A|nr:ribosomal protein S6 kinase-related protein [Patella vulgata]
MGNSQEKLPLRKTQSVPDTQNLSINEDFKRNKSRFSNRLFKFGSSKDLSRTKITSNGKGVDETDKAQWNVPWSEALFLPDFPIRGDAEEQDYVVIETLAKGAYGNVQKVQKEDEKRFYAMKILEKQQIIDENAIQQCKDEAAIQSMLGDHPFIVKIHEYWQSKEHLYIVLDYVPHGDLFSLWTFHTMFPERLVRIYIAQMGMVLDHLHNSGVIYRDVKMENILFDPQGNVQLIDFGLAKWLQKTERTRTVCGTLQYMAPEVLAMWVYDHAVDWWSLGILMYAMLCGKYPVDGAKDHKDMAKHLADCDFLMPGTISDDAQDVVNKLLTKNPLKRLTDLNTFQHLPFFENLNFTSLIERKITPMDVVPRDFFPMTGLSWAPFVADSEEEKNFQGFDGTNCVWNLPEDTVPVFV